MADCGDHLHEVLDGYAKFLQQKNLALDKHQPYLVRWVREFLLFARAHAGYSFEQTLERFLAEVGGRLGTKPWQLQHPRNPGTAGPQERRDDDDLHACGAGTEDEGA